MSESGEETALLDTRERQSEHIYSNIGYGSRRSSTVSLPQEDDASLTVDELLYRIQYAFLDKGYDVEADAYKVLKTCSREDFDKILHSLNSTPLNIRQKLNIHKLIRSGGNARNRLSNGRDNEVPKKKKGRKLSSYHLWEGAITQITAYFGSNVASYFRFVRTVVYLNALMALLLLAFITVPEFVDGNFQTNVTFGGHFGDLSNSFMFYGLYQENISFMYNLPLAYFLTWLSANLVCFLCIITIMIVRYRKSKLSEDQGSEYKFAWRTFCIWDFSMTSRQGVMDLRTSLRTEIKEMVREEKSALDVELYKKCMWYLGRLVSNVLVLGLLVGSGYLIYTVADTDNILPDSAADGLKDLFQKYQLTVVVAGLKFVVPPIFQQLVLLEGWHPRVETKITLVRTTVFYIASLLVFVTSLYDVTDDCSANSTIIAENQNNYSCCWENEIGEEVLKVILVDLGLILAVGSLVHLSRALIVKCCCRSVGYSKFDIVSCVLDVVYGQSLVWLGLYFSPLLAALGTIKLIILFYFRYFIAKVAMLPPKHLFRASSTGNFYLAILMLYLFISLFPMAYSVIEFTPSSECGPFQVYDRPYRVVSELIGELPDWLETVFDYLGTPSVFVPILIFMIMVAVYFKVKSSSYKRLIAELRRQLKFERKVEKRKIFATGRAMSGAVLNRYTSQETLVSNLSTPTATRRRHSQKTDDIVDVVFEEDEIV